MKRESISVCMASYNGAKYIKKQIESIINQLSAEDELIIVDDCSTDNTVNIVKNINSEYIKIFENEKNIGYVKTFEKALGFSKNKYICLSDQDDIWIEGRLQKLVENIWSKDVLLVASNFNPSFENSNDDKDFFKLKKDNSSEYLGNIIRIFQGKSGYYGCTMIMNRELLKFILPFPNYIEAHDLWIAMNANLLKSVYHLYDDTLIYNVHQNNTSLKKRSFIKKIKTRYYFCQAIIDILKKINN